MVHKFDEVRHDLMRQLRLARYGIMSFLGFFLVAFLAVTGPIWMFILLINLPVILTLYFTFFYTNVS